MATREVGRGIGYRLSTDEGVSPAGFDKDVKSVERTIRSSQTPQNVYGVTGKAPTPQGGVQQYILVKDSANLTNLNTALKAINYSGGRDVTPAEVPFRYYEGSINLKGDEAKKMLQSVVEKFGGQITKTLGDEVFYTYAIEESLVQKFKAQKKSPSKMFESKTFKGARQSSLSYEIEQAQKEEQEALALQAKQEEKQRLLEDKKQKAYEQKERNAYNYEQRRIQRQIERLEGKTAIDGRTYAEIFEASRGENAPVLTRKEELEEYKRIEAEDKKVREEQAQKEKDKKEAETSRRKTLGTVLKVVAVLTTIASIARRILTAVLSSAVKAREDTITAHNLGMAYGAIQHYGFLEQAHGLKQGTFEGALLDIQSKFGNVTSLDEKALGELARVMGSEVQDLVLSGMGGKEPDKLMEKILDKYFASYKAGKNSLGQYVGEAQASRELVSALNRVSPALGAVLANMIETNRSGIWKDRVGSFKDYKGTVSPHRMLVTDIDQSAFQQLGQSVMLAGEEFKKLVADAGMKFAKPLSQLMNWISHSRFGMSDAEKHRASEREFKEAKEDLTKLTGIKTAQEASFQSLLKRVLSPEQYAKYKDVKLSDITQKKGEKARELSELIPVLEDPSLFIAMSMFSYTEREAEELAKKINKRKAGEDFYHSRENYTDEMINLNAQEEAKRFLGIDTGKGSRRSTTLRNQLLSYSRGASLDTIMTGDYSGSYVDIDKMATEKPELYAVASRAIADMMQGENGSLFSRTGISSKYGKDMLRYASQYFYGKGGKMLTSEAVGKIFANAGTDQATYKKLMRAQQQAFMHALLMGAYGGYSKEGSWLINEMESKYFDKFETDYSAGIKAMETLNYDKIQKGLISSGKFTEKQLAGVNAFDWTARQSPSSPLNMDVSVTFIDSEGKARQGNIGIRNSAGTTTWGQISGTAQANAVSQGLQLKNCTTTTR